MPASRVGYVLGTRTSLGRWLRTANRGHPGGAFYELREWPFALADQLGELPAPTDDGREGELRRPAAHARDDGRADPGVSSPHRCDAHGGGRGAHSGGREPQWEPQWAPQGEREPERAHAWGAAAQGGSAGGYEDDDDDEML